MTSRTYRTAVVVFALAVTSTILLGPARTNPPTDPLLRLEATTMVPGQVRTTLERACFDCHSDETRWPWYSVVPPASWLVAWDVDHGRGQLNFSHWAEYNRFDRADLLDEMCKRVEAREMPPSAYRLMHDEAELKDADVEALCAWTRAEADRMVGEPPQDAP